MSISEEIRKPSLEPLRIYMEPMPYKQNAHSEDAKTDSGNAQREDRSPLSGLEHPANAGLTQRLECDPYKVEVGGSNPSARTIPTYQSENENKTCIACGKLALYRHRDSYSCKEHRALSEKAARMWQIAEDPKITRAQQAAAAKARLINNPHLQPRTREF